MEDSCLERFVALTSAVANNLLMFVLLKVNKVNSHRINKT